jgi:hypothetical protein
MDRMWGPEPVRPVVTRAGEGWKVTPTGDPLAKRWRTTVALLETNGKAGTAANVAEVRGVSTRTAQRWKARAEP